MLTKVMSRLDGWGRAGYGFSTSASPAAGTRSPT